MRRKPWFELHDHPFFPPFLRHLVTDALEAIWNATETYHPIVPRLKRALEQAKTHRVVDLCSGGGGPWLRLESSLAAAGYPVSVLLTDKYPNRQAFEKASRESLQKITGCEASVDVTSVPAELSGFRTIFSAFHHFDPKDARAILADSFHRGEGIAVFEAAEYSAYGLGAVCLVPLLVLTTTPRVRPFKWSRFLWTYLVPVIPCVLWIDGILSSLRSYSQSDMKELVAGLSLPGYSWQIGQDREGLRRVTYLIGSPDGCRIKMAVREGRTRLI